MKVLNESTLECLVIKNVIVQGLRESIELQILNCFSSAKYNELMYSKSLNRFEITYHWTESTKLNEISFAQKFGLDSIFSFFNSLKKLQHIDIVCEGNTGALQFLVEKTLNSLPREITDLKTFKLSQNNQNSLDYLTTDVANKFFHDFLQMQRKLEVISFSNMGLSGDVISTLLYQVILRAPRSSDMDSPEKDPYNKISDDMTPPSSFKGCYRTLKVLNIGQKTLRNLQ